MRRRVRRAAAGAGRGVGQLSALRVVARRRTLLARSSAARSWVMSRVGRQAGTGPAAGIVMAAGVAILVLVG